MNNTINFQDLFKGFQDTPNLWEASAVYNFKQFCTKPTLNPFTLNAEPKKLRLGKWVENFVSFQLQQDRSIKILEENLQVINNKITIGELDLLILQNDIPIHIEIIYKFYLFDDSNKDQSNPLNNWVGPNQNDALVYKLKKLKEKQFPLLHHPKTQTLLQKYSFDINSIKQQVCFKAQLFLPYNNQNIEISPLNPNGVVGWYLNFEDINKLKNFQVFIPEKLEWLSSPKLSVNWLEFETGKSKISIAIKNKRSPLCWVKNSNNQVQKCFITWW